MKKYLKIASPFIISVILIMSIAGAGAAAADSEKKIDWSDPEVLKDLYEKITETDDPDKAFAELPPKAQKALMEALTQNLETKIKIIDGGERGGGRNILIVLNQYSSIFQTHIWSYYQQVAWTYDDVYVTSVPIHQSWGWAQWPWSFNGVISESESGGAGYTWFYRFSQGQFSFNIGPWPIITDTPWISFTAYGTGNYSYSYSY